MLKKLQTFLSTTMCLPSEVEDGDQLAPQHLSVPEALRVQDDLCDELVVGSWPRAGTVASGCLEAFASRRSPNPAGKGPTGFRVMNTPELRSSST